MPSDGFLRPEGCGPPLLQPVLLKFPIPDRTSWRERATDSGVVERGEGESERMKHPTGDMIPGLEHAFDEDEERMIRRHRDMAFVEIEEEEDIAGVVNSGFGAEMMEVDDRDDPVDVLGDLDKHLHPVDSDFFNSFADDFDDTDLS